MKFKRQLALVSQSVAVGAGTINPKLLTAAERIQYEGYLRREDTNTAMLKQAETGASIKEIVRLTGIAGASDDQTYSVLSACIK